jgi:hypothetical protein
MLLKVVGTPISRRKSVIKEIVGEDDNLKKNFGVAEKSFCCLTRGGGAMRCESKAKAGAKVFSACVSSARRSLKVALLPAVPKRQILGFIEGRSNFYAATV